MKKCTLFTTTICILCMLSFSAKAQTNNNIPNRIKVSYGDALYNTASIGMLDALIGGILFHDAEEISTFGSISVGYRHLTCNQRWTLGADFNYTHFKETYKNQITCDFSLYTILAVAECNYIKKGIVRLYGSVGVGGSFSSDAGGFAFQLNPIALRVGNNRIAGFVEAGIGTKGLFNVGLEIGF